MNSYEGTVYVTTLTAFAVFLVFLGLVLRRFLSERKRVKRDERDTEITRAYLQRVAGMRVATERHWRRQSKLAAISRILPLLRGGERTRLLQIAEFDGLLRNILRMSYGIARSDRIDAIHVLQRFGSEACIARLRQFMARDRSSRVRLEAAFALGANGSLPPPREMLSILGWNQRPPSRLDTALLRSAAPLYPDQMLLLLEDDLQPVWRAQIIDALGWSESMQALPMLETAAQNPSVEVRCAVLRASSRLGHPSAATWAKAALTDKTPAVRLQAIAACRRLGLTDVVPQLRAMREDPRLWVRLRAEQALEQLASEAEEAAASTKLAAEAEEAATSARLAS